MSFIRETFSLTSGVNWVGVKDWDRRMFDRLIPLPDGTSYNSYLVQGGEKTVLIDSVNPGFENQLEQKISQHVSLSGLDYVVMNHAEPDHANAIGHILSLAPRAKVLVSEKGQKMADSLYCLPPDRIKIVQDNETLDLGEKSLRFIQAPWLHWPETMFTYLEEDEILFTCDFFGAHVASSQNFSSQMGDKILEQAKSYFGEIMMPFRKRAKSAMDKVEKYEINTIAPSHGPIHDDPQLITDAYRKWVGGQVVEKVLVPYISMWGSTERMVKVFSETVASEGVEVVPYNLASGELGRLANLLVDSGGIVIGTPTVLAGPHPSVQHIAYLATKLNPPTKYLGVLESHGWAGGALRELSDMFSNMGAEIVGSVEVLGSPTEEDVNEIVQFAREFAAKIKNL